MNFASSFFFKKGHCIHILGHIFMGLGIQRSLDSITLVISTSVGSKVILGSSACGSSFFEKRVTVSTYLDILQWDLNTMILSNVFSWDLGIMILG